jgi:hypothetical protein
MYSTILILYFSELTLAFKSPKTIISQRAILTNIMNGLRNEMTQHQISTFMKGYYPVSEHHQTIAEILEHNYLSICFIIILFGSYVINESNSNKLNSLVIYKEYSKNVRTFILILLFLFTRDVQNAL